MSYALAETFYTLQGEGYHAGTPALFIRFAGCSMWSGQQEHRERDATRNGAGCPLFCDTDFRPRERLSAEQLIELGCLRVAGRGGFMRSDRHARSCCCASRLTPPIRRLGCDRQRMREASPCAVPTKSRGSTAATVERWAPRCATRSSDCSSSSNA